MVEHARQREVLRLAGDRRQIGQRLRHPAELGLEHRLLLRVGETIGAELHPSREALRHVERLPVVAELVRVDEAGEDLVQRVIRRPDRATGLDAIEQLFRERGEISRVRCSCGKRVLHLGKLRDENVGARLEALVAGVGVHQRERRQVVACAVPAELDVRRFPSAERLCRRRQSGVQPKRVQQAIRIEREEKLLVAQHRVAERSVEQPDLSWQKLPNFCSVLRHGPLGGDSPPYGSRKSEDEREDEGSHTTSRQTRIPPAR